MYGRLLMIFKKMLDQKLISNHSYLLYLLARIFGNLSLLVPNLYLPSMMKSKNISEIDASFAVAVIGASNGISRLMFGIVTAFPQHVIKINAVATLCLSIAISTLPLSTQPLHFYMLAAFIGFWQAPLISLEISSMVHLVGVDLLSSAYGICDMFYGITVLAGPAIVGGFVDYFQEYNKPFFMAASSFLVASFLHCSCEVRHQYSKYAQN